MRLLLTRAGLLLVLAASAAAQSVTLSALADTTLYAESPGNANGGGPHLQVGANSQGHARRALLRFDVAASLPAGARVLSARLELHCSQLSGGPSIVRAHRLDASWGEGTVVAPGSGGQGAPAGVGDATWSHRFLPAIPWSNAGGDFAPRLGAAVNVSGVGPFVLEGASLAADVEAWLDAPASDHGWILLGEEESPGSAKRLDSRENQDALLRPRLVLELEPGRATCTDADGASALCPCANPGAPGHGCNGPHEPGGVRLSAQDFAPDGTGGGTVTFVGAGFPPAFAPGAVLLRSTAAPPVPFDDGVLCLASPQTFVGGGSAAAGGLQLALQHGAGTGAFTYQLWFRSLPAAFCTPAGASLSNAYTLVW